MNLKEIRKEKRLSQTEVSRQAGISQSMYQAIESGVRQPSVKTAKAVAAVLGIRWTQFFEDD